MTGRTTTPHTTYGTAYSSACVTLCDACAQTGARPLTDPVEPWRSDDPDRCAGCGLIYDAREADRADADAR